MLGALALLDEPPVWRVKQRALLLYVGSRYQHCYLTWPFEPLSRNTCHLLWRHSQKLPRKSTCVLLSFRMGIGITHISYLRLTVPHNCCWKVSLNECNQLSLEGDRPRGR
jgi:hypothetical protein